MGDLKRIIRAMVVAATVVFGKALPAADQAPERSALERQEALNAQAQAALDRGIADRNAESSSRRRDRQAADAAASREFAARMDHSRRDDAARFRELRSDLERSSDELKEVAKAQQLKVDQAQDRAVTESAQRRRDLQSQLQQRAKSAMNAAKRSSNADKGTGAKRDGVPTSPPAAADSQTEDTLPHLRHQRQVDDARNERAIRELQGAFAAARERAAADKATDLAADRSQLLRARAEKHLQKEKRLYDILDMTEKALKHTPPADTHKMVLENMLDAIGLHSGKRLEREAEEEYEVRRLRQIMDELEKREYGPPAPASAGKHSVP